MKLLHIAISLLLLILPDGHITAQSLERSVIAAWGDFNVGGGYSLSATLGETMTESLLATSYHLTQGFQQPTDDATYIRVFQDPAAIEVYPNPTSEFIYLDSDKPLEITMFNVLGQRLRIPISKRDHTTELYVGSLSPGTYILSCFITTNGLQKSIKIVIQ